MLFALLSLLTCSAFCQNNPPRNVVFLSVDTLRADRLGCYGYPLPTSPNIDNFASQAMLFEDCICEVPLTSPSFCSMHSSNFPRMTATTRNGLPISESVPLVAEVFQAAGYHTFCVQSNWTLKAKLSGLQRGFDVYEDDFHQKRWGLIKPERDGDDVSRIALDLLKKRDMNKPFFAWIHFSDPHAPYKMHKGFNPAGKKQFNVGKKKKKVRTRYDSEVAFTDAEIAKVLAALPENTAVLFVGDHGESLYEHDYLGHGRRIYQTGMHVPLIVHAPGLKPGRTARPARGIDIGPTLLGLASLPRIPGMLGLDLLNDPPPPTRPRVIETYGGAVPHLPGAKAIMADAAPQWQGVLLDGWKLLQSPKSTELYYLPDDPQELNNLADTSPEHVTRLNALITQWDTATVHAEEGEQTLSEEDIEALKGLGYIE
jgi:arylsulfatase A-like enzyme